MTGWPYEKLVLKLWETVFDKGLCSILRPGQIRREGFANIQIAQAQTLLLAQAEKQAEDIRNGKLNAKLENGVVSIEHADVAKVPISEPADIYEAVRDDIIERRIKEDINVAKTILKTEAELSKSNDDAPQESVDADWLYRWRDYVSKVSSDDVQHMWARILAGEIKSPGRYSYRTMEFIQNLSAHEAKEIEKVIPFIFKEGFIYRGYLTSNPKGGMYRDIHKWLDWDTLYRMQELGLLHSIHEERASLTLLSEKNNKFFLRGVDKAIIYMMPEDRSCEITNIPVTKLGVELMEIAGGNSNLDYMRLVAERIKHSGGVVHLSDYNEIDGNNIFCFNINEI